MAGKFESELATFDRLHATINVKLQILHNMRLRATVSGAADVADKIRQTQSQIEENLTAYAEMARELAKDDAADE
jgi:hypothetical protein